MAQKVALDSIRSLTFYKDELTQSRRTSPIPQLTCIGKPCQYYQPDVVRCVNSGGRGLDVEWKCEADLPEQLRLGRVEVSCEGWSKAGDPYVLKGSCGLEYRLLRVPNALNKDSAMPGFLQQIIPKDTYEAVFMLVWSLLLFFILYHFLKACFTSRNNQQRPPNPRPATGPRGGGGGGGWFSGRPDDDNDPPPPYFRSKPSSSSSTQQQGWRPGFWTGLGLGGLAGAMMNNRRNQPPPPPPQPRLWDWERPWGGWGQRATPRQSAWGPSSSEGVFARRAATRSGWMGSNADRGEGSSDLGSMRTSTGYGGSRVR